MFINCRCCCLYLHNAANKLQMTTEAQDGKRGTTAHEKMYWNCKVVVHWRRNNICLSFQTRMQLAYIYVVNSSNVCIIITILEQLTYLPSVFQQAEEILLNPWGFLILLLIIRVHNVPLKSPPIYRQQGSICIFVCEKFSWCISKLFFLYRVNTKTNMR